MGTPETAEALCWFVVTEQQKEKRGDKLRFDDFVFIWNKNTSLTLNNEEVIAREMRVMKSYLLNCLIALNRDYICTAAAKGEDFLIQVTARAVKGLCKEQVWLVTFDDHDHFT